MKNPQKKFSRPFYGLAFLFFTDVAAPANFSSIPPYFDVFYSTKFQDRYKPFYNTEYICRRLIFLQLRSMYEILKPSTVIAMPPKSGRRKTIASFIAINENITPTAPLPIRRKSCACFLQKVHVSQNAFFG